MPLFSLLLSGTSTALVLDVGEAARSLAMIRISRKPLRRFNAARLSTGTHYFPARYVDACMALSYYWSGVGSRKSLKVLQRNAETSCIYADEYSGGGGGGGGGEWNDIQIQLDLRYGDAQFVLEFIFDIPLSLRIQEQDNAQVNYDQLGYIAIRDFSIGYGQCDPNVIQITTKNRRRIGYSNNNDYDSDECDVPYLIQHQQQQQTQF